MYTKKPKIIMAEENCNRFEFTLKCAAYNNRLQIVRFVDSDDDIHKKYNIVLKSDDLSIRPSQIDEYFKLTENYIPKDLKIDELGNFISPIHIDVIRMEASRNPNSVLRYIALGVYTHYEKYRLNLNRLIDTYMDIADLVHYLNGQLLVNRDEYYIAKKLTSEVFYKNETVNDLYNSLLLDFN